MVALSPSMTSFILDAEIVATDTKDGSLKTFQELSNRARTNVKLENVTIPVSVFAFDLLYLNGAVRFISISPFVSEIPVLTFWLRFSPYSRMTLSQEERSFMISCLLTSHRINSWHTFVM